MQVEIRTRYEVSANNLQYKRRSQSSVYLVGEEVMRVVVQASYHPPLLGGNSGGAIDWMVTIGAVICVGKI